MMQFTVHDENKPASDLRLRNAYMIGADSIAVRGDVSTDGSSILCQKKELGAAALALQRPVGDCGELTLQTTILPDREEPYLLNVELARHRLMLLYSKLEEWGMFDLPDSHPAMQRLEVARKLFLAALGHCPARPAEAERLAQDALVTAIDASEELALAHAQWLLLKRKNNGSLPRTLFGCGVPLDRTHDRIRGAISANFDFTCIPTCWKDLAPAEGEYRWEALDQWVNWSVANRLPIMAGPVLSLNPHTLPDWIFIWENDYEQLRDVLYEHVEEVVGRYRNSVAAWNIASGLHVNSSLSFAFEQLLDLTRMATSVVRKLAPQARVLVEITHPFGEYFARNQRSIPPAMYIDLLLQGGVSFDAFSVKLLMGQAVLGQWTRDLMQLSNLLDGYADLEKPVHVTLGAPSEPVEDYMILHPETPNQPLDANSGSWRRPWSTTVQAHWLEAMMQIALSKPFVESVAWRELMDHEAMELPMSGLIDAEFQPKLGLVRYAAFRRNLWAAAPNAESGPPSEAI